MLLVLIMVVALTLLLPREVTSATWTSTGSVSTGTLTAKTVPDVGTASCASAGAGTVTVSWPGLGPRYRYRVTYYRGSTQIGTPTSVAPSGAGTVSTTIGLGDVGLGVSANLQARVVAIAASSSTWISPTPSVVSIRTTLLGVLGVACGHSSSTTVAITGLGQDTGSSASDQITNVAANSLTGTGDPGSTITVTRAGSTIGTASVTSAGSWSAAVTLADGTQTLTATATSPDGFTATANLAGVVLDTVAPTIVQTSGCVTVGNAVSGQNGQTWCRQTSRALTVAYTDPGGSGVVASSQRLTVAGSTAASSTTTTLGEGAAITVVATATDVAGNTGSGTGRYWNDGTAPAVTIRAPAPTTSVASLALRSAIQTTCGADTGGCGVATDTVSGVASTTFEMQKSALGTTTCLSTSGSYATATCGLRQTPAGAASAWQLQPTGLQTYPVATFLTTFTLQVATTDAAGNVGTGQVVVTTVL